MSARMPEDVAREVVRMLDEETSDGWPDAFAAQVEGVAALLTGWAEAIRAEGGGPMSNPQPTEGGVLGDPKNPKGSAAMTETERRLAAAIAAHESWAATEDRSARTAPARRALEQKFLDAAGGDPKRAESLRRAHYKRLALKSAQSRRRAREATTAAEAAEAELKALGGVAAC